MTEQMMDERRTCRIDLPTLAIIAVVAAFSGRLGLAATSADSLPSPTLDGPTLGLSATQATPDPSLSAEDVVRVQMRALRTNGPDDEGIRVTYRFASPSNKRVTGPYERFAEMIKAPPYDAMLNAKKVELGTLRVAEGRALQEVLVTTVDGQRVAYLFMLRRQTEAPVEGCWMTEAVIVEREQPEEHYKSGPPGFG
jgi:hypothetical protein